MLNQNAVYIGAFLIVIGTVYYIKDIYKGNTRPNLVTWFLWSLAPLIAFAAQLKNGLGSEVILTLAVGLCPLAVFIVGLKKGTFRPSRFDLVCGSASIIALILWQLTGSGIVAILLSIIADGLAATPTLIKAYRQPQSESPFLFALFAISAALTLLSLDTWTIENSAFAFYIFALYVTLFVFVKLKLQEKLTNRFSPLQSQSDNLE